MQIDTVVFFQITDPKLYTYGVENPIMAIENLSATTLRNIIGDMEPVSYTHLRAHETDSYLVCRLLLEKKKKYDIHIWQITAI